jgi:hypothetical protein
MGLIGCGVVALICVLAFVAFIFYVQNKPEAVTDFMMKQIEKNYAPDVTQQEKEDLRTAYAAFRKTLEEDKDKKPPKEPMERLQTTLRFGGKSGQITREQVRELTRAFREAAGLEPERTPGAAPAEVTESPEPTEPAPRPRL